MEQVQMIKEEIRRMMIEAEDFTNDYLELFQNASKDTDKDYFSTMSELYANDYLAYKRVLDYIEKEVE